MSSCRASAAGISQPRPSSSTSAGTSKRNRCRIAAMVSSAAQPFLLKLTMRPCRRGTSFATVLTRQQGSSGCRMEQTTKIKCWHASVTQQKGVFRTRRQCVSARMQVDLMFTAERRPSTHQKLCPQGNVSGSHIKPKQTAHVHIASAPEAAGVAD